MRKAFILLPAFNEEESIEVLFENIKAADLPWDVQIVLCDDGSRDATVEKARATVEGPSLTVLTHKINRGLGETARDLFEYAAEHSDADDLIFRLDCDRSHDPIYFKTMADELDTGVDVVIASRFRPGGGQLGVSRYRRFISFCANLYMKLLFPVKGVRDYTCGYRCYRASVIKRAIEAYGNNFIQLKGIGFTCTLEKLIKLKLLGMRFSEVPFVLRYDQKKSESKMVSSITMLGYFVMTILYYWPFGGWRSRYVRIPNDPVS